MNYIPEQCAARSVGVANVLVNTLIQALLTSYCDISNPGWPKDCGETAVDKSYYDFIVVGAGTAGSVIAGRLSENPAHKVLLIEAGDDPPIESEIPNGYFALLNTFSTAWVYEEYAKNACLDAKNICYSTRGKMLGGSLAHNAMVYTRGRKYDFDYWASLGNKGWDYDSVLPFFKRYEANQDPEIANIRGGFYHNQTGPIKISLMYKDPMLRVYLDAAAESGNPRVIDINADKTLGYLWQQGYIFDGVRQSSAKNYLIPSKPNLCVVKNAVAYKILFDGNKKAIGVEYEYKGTKNMTAYANKEVIVSAGTIESAKLLLLSGIGPKNQLEKFKIPVVSELPVGENLLEHLSIMLFYQFDKHFTAPTDLDDTYQYFIHRTGPLSSAGVAVGGLENPVINIQYQKSEIQHVFVRFSPNSSIVQNFQSDVVKSTVVPINKEYDIGAAIPKITRPKSVGYIRLQSPSFKDQPFINANNLDDPRDINTMVLALKHLAAFENTLSFRKLKGKVIRIPNPTCDQFRYRSDAYWTCYVRYYSESAYHSVGTCKMAPKNISGVVDIELRVYGVKNLRVADASVMPYIVSNDLSATAIMIGEKAADMIKKAYP